MFEGKAQKLAETIGERMRGGVTTEVETHSRSPEKTAPGAGPVKFVWYEIKISDGRRNAGIEVEDAKALLGDMDETWGPDQLFAAIEELGIEVETAG